MYTVHSTSAVTRTQTKRNYSYTTRKQNRNESVQEVPAQKQIESGRLMFIILAVRRRGRSSGWEIRSQEFPRG